MWMATSYFLLNNATLNWKVVTEVYIVPQVSLAVLPGVWSGVRPWGGWWKGLCFLESFGIHITHDYQRSIREASLIKMSVSLDVIICFRLRGIISGRFNETPEGTVTMFPGKQMNVMNLTGLFVEFWLKMPTLQRCWVCVLLCCTGG